MGTQMSTGGGRSRTLAAAAILAQMLATAGTCKAAPTMVQLARRVILDGPPPSFSRGGG